MLLAIIAVYLETGTFNILEAAAAQPFAGNFDRDGSYDDVGVYRASNTTKYIDFDHNGSTDGTGRAGTGVENCHPVVTSELSGDHIWLFCNGDWWAKDPDSAY